MRLLTIGLIVSLLMHYSDARNCILEGGEYNEGINIYTKVDDDADEFLTISTQYVNSAVAIITENNYVDVSCCNDDKLTFKPTQEFKNNFEINTAYTSNPRVNVRIKLTCADGDTYEIDYYHSINDINTFPPVFSKPAYDFTIPMPIGGSVDLTIFGEAILATDYDVSNEGIDFKIEGESSDSLAVVWEGRTTDSETKGKQHKGVLRTKSPLRLTKDTTYVITATDKGQPDTKSATASVNIKIDLSGTLPSSPSFEIGFYQAVYDNSNPEKHSISNTPIKVSEGITTDDITLGGVYAQHFEHIVGADGLMEISLTSNLPEDVINVEPFVALSITASIENAEVSATTSLIVTMPKKQNVSFGTVYYEASYSEKEGTPQITKVTIDVNEEAEVEIVGEYKAYFQYNPTDKSIDAIGLLPQDVQSDKAFIDVTIKATLGTETAEAVLIVTMPEKENLSFGKIYYKASYSEKEGTPEITKVTIDVNQEAEVEVIGDYSVYFKYNPADKSVDAIDLLPPDIQSDNNFIDVTIKATLGIDTAEAVLIVTMPEKENLSFGKIYYKASYSEEGGLPQITKVTIDITDEAEVEVIGDYSVYFKYNAADKSVDAIDLLPPDIQSDNNFIDVTIKATLGIDTAEAVLIVTMPEKENLSFGKIYYKASYSDEEGLPQITKVTIDITDEAEVEVIGAYKAYFQYNPTDKSIDAIGLLPQEVQSDNDFIDVTIKATLGTETAEAVMIVTMPEKENLSFGKIYYKASYSEEEGTPQITKVTIDITETAEVEITGDYSAYFKYNPTDKSVDAVDLLPPDVQSDNEFIDVTIKATLGIATAEAVLVVTMPGKETLSFGKIYYKASYSEKEGTPQITKVTIDINDEAEVEVIGDYNAYFKYNPTDKSIDAIDLLPPDVQSDNDFIDVTIKATLGIATAEAVLVVTMPGKENLSFGKIYYKASYSEKEGTPQITKVTIDITDEAEVEVIGDYNAYFKYNPTDKSIDAIDLLPPDVQSDNDFIDVTIKATLGIATAEAVLVVTMPGKENLSFGKIYYKASYSEKEGTPQITKVTIDITDEAEVEVIGDYNAYFKYNPTDKSIDAIDLLPPDVQSDNDFIDVTIKATLGIATAEAVLVVTMPGKETLSFGKIYYKASYSEKEGTPQITKVTIDINDEAEVEVIGDYNAYFKYNPTDKSIDAIDLLPPDVQSDNDFIDVTIKATLGIATAEAVLIVTMPGKENLSFGKIYYKASYSEKEGTPQITKVTIDINDEAEVEVIGDYNAYFKYNPTDKSIDAIDLLPPEVQSDNDFIDVTIKATLGIATAEAVLVVTMPGKENLSFGKIYYKASYSEKEETPQITKVTIDINDEAEVEVIGDYNAYFKYNPTDKSIDAIDLLPPEVQSDNDFIDVTIKATLGIATAEAVLVVTMPGKENLSFGKIYYKASYSEKEGTPQITKVTIDITDEAEVEVIGDYSAYFKYNPADKSVEAIDLLPPDIQSDNNFIDVTIKATLGIATAEAVLVVTMPGKENLSFGKIYYKASYSEKEGTPQITKVTIDITDEAEVEVIGDYKAYFKYNPTDKSIDAIDLLPPDVQSDNEFIDVTIKATLGIATADAVLVVTMPGKENLSFGKIYYKASYFEKEGTAQVTKVTIDIIEEAEVEVVGDYSAYFKYNPSDKSIDAIDLLPPDVQSGNDFIDVTIKATLGIATAEAVLVVTMPGKENLSFGRIYYKASYSEKEGTPQITKVTIDITDEAEVEVIGDYKAYFKYNPTDKSIDVIDLLPPDVQSDNEFIDVTIKATLGIATADAVLVVTMPGKENLSFGKIYYKASYFEKEGTAQVTKVTIDIIEEAEVEVVGDYSAYFKYNPSDKSIDAIDLLPPDVQSGNDFIDVTIKATLGIATAEAVLVVTMPGKENLSFGKIYYKASYSEKEGTPQITKVTIDITDDAEVEVIGDYSAYFKYNPTDKSVDAIDLLPPDIQSDNEFIDVTIKATLGIATAEAVLVVTMPGKENLSFGKIYYKASYYEEDGTPQISKVTIDIIEEATVEVTGDYSAYFKYNPTDKSVDAIDLLPPDIQSDNEFIDVTIKATLGIATAEAVLVITMPGKENLSFGKIYYKASYYEEDGTPQITKVTIDIIEEATVEVIGDYSAFFKYNPTDKSVDVIDLLPPDIQSDNEFIDVTVKATLGIATAEAVLVVTMPGKENLSFGKIYYKASYYEEDGTPQITKVTIDIIDEATVEVIGDYSAFFKYNPTDKSVDAIDLLPPDIQSDNEFIDVTVKATLGIATAEAVLVVTMPGKENLSFGKIYYKASYYEEDGTPQITKVTIDIIDEATVEVIGDYSAFFKYNPTDKSVDAIDLLPPDIQSDNEFIDVTVKATLGIATAEAVLVVTMPGKENLSFGKIYYKASYYEEDGTPQITKVTIDIIDEAEVEVIGDYNAYFKYNSIDKSIDTIDLLPPDVQSDNDFIDVTIKATLGIATAEAVVIVTMPGKETVSFEKVYYEAKYFEKEEPQITEVLIDVTEGANVDVVGTYKEYFEYDNIQKFVKVIKALSLSDFKNCYIDVTIQATLGSAKAEAVLIVSPSATITFEGQLVFEGNPGDGISGQITAKSTISEDIIFSFAGDIPQELQQHLSLTDDGNLKSIELPPGFYEINVSATGTISKASATAPVKILIGAGETCPDGTIFSTYSFQAFSVKENEAETIVLPLPAESSYHYEVVDVHPNRDRFELNARGDFVAKLLDRESDEFGSGKAQYIAKIKLIPNTEGRRFSPRSTLKTFFVSKEETRVGDDKCYALDPIINDPNQIVVGISVEDVNDHEPTFEKTKIVVGYPESDLLKTVSPPYVTIVKATDEDIGEYASLKYSIDSTKVVIDENTGYIYPTDLIYDNDEVLKVTATDENGNGKTSNVLELTIKTLKKEHLCVLKYHDKHLEDLDSIMVSLATYADVRYLSAAVLPGTNPYGRDSNDRSLVITAYAFDGSNNLLMAEELIERLEDIDGLSTEPLPTPEDCTTEIPGGDDCDDECSKGGLIAGVIVLAILLALCLGGFIAFYILKFRKTKSYNQMEEEGIPKDVNKESALEKPRFTKNPAPVPPNTKAEIDERRPTGYLRPADFIEEVPSSPSLTPPSEVFNNEIKERRKSVVFNSNIEEINIEREAEDQDADKKSPPDEVENTKL